MGTIALKRPPKEGGGGDRTALPEGKYRAVLSNGEDAATAIPKAGAQYGGFVVDVEITQGDFKGRTLEKMWVFPASEALLSLVEVLGGDTDDEEFDLDYKDLDGLEVNVYLGQRTKKGYVNNTIKRFAPAPKR